MSTPEQRLLACSWPAYSLSQFVDLLSPLSGDVLGVASTVVRFAGLWLGWRWARAR